MFFEKSCLEPPSSSLDRRGRAAPSCLTALTCLAPPVSGLTALSRLRLSRQVATGKEGRSLDSSSCPIGAKTTATVRRQQQQQTHSRETSKRSPVQPPQIPATPPPTPHSPLPTDTRFQSAFQIYFPSTQSAGFASSRQLLVIAYSEANLG